MIIVKECTNKIEAKKLLTELGMEYVETERFFIMTENDKLIGAGTLALEGKYIVFKRAFVKKDLPFSYYDLLCRSVLNVIRKICGVPVKAPDDDYFLLRGFKKSNGFCLAYSHEIDLSGDCSKNGGKN